MKEVENYVEHIRRLSNDHEALTLEFEAENEQLKAEVEKLNQELESKTFIINLNPYSPSHNTLSLQNPL